VVYLTGQHSKLATPDGKVDESQYKAGQASWGGPTKHKEGNVMDTPVEVVRSFSWYGAHRIRCITLPIYIQRVSLPFGLVGCANGERWSPINTIVTEAFG
jgi:hypothetical protein